MKKQRFILVICVCILFVSCTSEEAKKAKIEAARVATEESAAKKAVLSRLKDPDSVKFGTFSLFGETHACLTVNARNSMGGYTGNQEAYLYKINGEWNVSQIQADENLICTKYMREVAANSLKRQGAGHIGKVLQVQTLKSDSSNFIEVESNGEKLWIARRSYLDSAGTVKVKVGDTIEIPDTLPGKNYRSNNQIIPIVIEALRELKIVKE